MPPHQAATPPPVPLLGKRHRQVADNRWRDRECRGQQRRWWRAECCPTGPDLAGPVTEDFTDPVPKPSGPCRRTMAPLLPTVHDLGSWLMALIFTLPASMPLVRWWRMDSVCSSLAPVNFDYDDVAEVTGGSSKAWLHKASHLHFSALSPRLRHAKGVQAPTGPRRSRRATRD